ncbi:MAG: molybdenum cofactor biosynthesis protein MoaE [Acidimicrobiales bacterium]
MIGAESGSDWLALTGDVLSAAKALEWVKGPSFGAVVGFEGVVRDHGDGLVGVTAIDYEAYEEQVTPRLEALADKARQAWPETGRIVVWHRAGHVALGEASVVIAVSAPHRAEAFEACQYLIDTLKATLPIWKEEHFPGGSAWSSATRPVAQVEEGPL